MDVQESLLEKEAVKWATEHGKSIDDTLKIFEVAADFIYDYVVERAREDTPSVVLLMYLRRVCDLD